MIQLKARARAEEAVYANRQTEEFLAQARGLRRLGEWAASQMMGSEAPAVAAYADALVRSGIAGSDAFQSVEDDLRLAGQVQNAETASSLFALYVAEARRELEL